MPATPKHSPRGTRLVAVVVTHDRFAQLRRTLARLLQAPAEVLKAVVVVDNASTDGTGEWLGSLDDPRVEVVTLEENRGGPGALPPGWRRRGRATTRTGSW